MASLRHTSMSSVQEPPNDQQFMYLKYVTYRNGGQPIEQLVAEYGLRSPDALYRKLRQDGFPVCEACGRYSKSPDHCARGDRRARGVGEIPSSYRRRAKPRSCLGKL